MHAVVTSSFLLGAVALSLTGCAHGQPKVVESQALSIRECVRSRMVAADLQVTEERMPGKWRRLVGRSAASTSSKQPMDMLSIWFTDSVFTMLGSTSQPVDRSVDSGSHMRDGSLDLTKSPRLHALEKKLATECRGYQAAPPGDG
jgi:hypothetical protein